MIFNEAAICANLSGALAQKVEQITETAKAIEKLSMFLDAL